MAQKTVQKAAAPAADVAAKAKEAVAAQATKEKAPRRPPTPTGYTSGGQGHKRVPWTQEELNSALEGSPAGVYLVHRENNGKNHYSIVNWNGTAVDATHGGCYDLERAQGFRDAHARAAGLQVADEPGGELRAPAPARQRAAKEGDAPADGATEAAEAPAAAAAPAKKGIVKKS